MVYNSRSGVRIQGQNLKLWVGSQGLGSRIKGLGSRDLGFRVYCRF
jgi:hypothetical protein